MLCGVDCFYRQHLREAFHFWVVYEFPFVLLD